jgi:hypothetical protein
VEPQEKINNKNYQQQEQQQKQQQQQQQQQQQHCTRCKNIKTRSASTETAIRFDAVKLHSFLCAGLAANFQLQRQY